MNEYPMIEMLAFYSRYDRLEKPAWRKDYLHYLKRVRSCHSRTDGDMKKSYYTVETQEGKIINLVYDEEELFWNFENEANGLLIDRVLVLAERHKHKPSRAHRVTPLRFEIFPINLIKKKLDGTELPFVRRVQPYRFRSGKLESAQVIDIKKRCLETTITTKYLHYLVETDVHRYFHLNYELDQQDWRFIEEVDAETFNISI